MSGVARNDESAGTGAAGSTNGTAGALPPPRTWLQTIGTAIAVAATAVAAGAAVGLVVDAVTRRDDAEADDSDWEVVDAPACEIASSGRDSGGDGAGVASDRSSAGAASDPTRRECVVCLAGEAV